MKNRIIRMVGVFLVLFTLFLCVPPPVFASPEPDLLDPLSIPKFENQLVSPPPVFEPTVVTNNSEIVRHEYDIAMNSFLQQILPPSMNLLTPVWGYGGNARDPITGASLGYIQSSPGPTFEAIRGIPTQVKWINNITSPHMLPVDPTLHWANPMNMPHEHHMTSSFPTYPPGFPEAQSSVPLVTHLHGAEVQSYSDGVPEQWYTSSGLHGPDYFTFEETDANSAVYYYPNRQPPTALWYHDHALGITRLNVMSGLAGFYFIRELNSSVDYVADLLPKGKYEMPLIIQDRTFYADGSLWYPAEGTNPDINPYWVEAFLGNTIMVNGKVWPNMDVAKGQYRLRILDASNTRIYGLSFLNTRTNTRVPFVQIGSDGGYLKTPVTLTELLLAPAERVDILVDFSGFDSGTKIILQNTALTGDFPSEEKTLGKIVQFTVTAENGYEAKTLPTLLNPTLAGDTFPNLPTPSKRRILTLFHVNGPQGPLMILLNGQRWGANISELPMLNATEEWVIVNLTNNAHPIHLHLIQFQTASRQNINITSYTTDWLTMQRELLGDYAAVPPWPTDFTPGELPVEPYLTGTPIPIPLNEVGWKDTVLVLPSTVTVIRARWASQDGSPFPFDATEGPAYVWHCHILEHEDNEMMRPYKVLPLSSEMPSQPISIVLILISLVVGIILLLFFLKKKWWKKAEK